jgi:Gpi18-like mannosyltransferase
MAARSGKMEIIRHAKSFRLTKISVITGIGIVIAAALRLSLQEFQSDDYRIFVQGWYQTIKGHGFGIFRSAFYDYSPPYPYILFVLSRVLPRISPVVAIKIPSIVADFVCAWYVWRVVRIKFPSGPAPMFAALALLFAPTVVFNSAFWGQTDMLYTAPLVASLYYLLRKKERSAWLAVGLAFSIKAQAIFIGPYLLALLLRRELSWRNTVWVPAVWLVSLVPAWIAGRPIYDLLTINPTQAAIQTAKLTWNAPNLYKWIPPEYAALFYPAGMFFGAGVAIIFIAAIYTSRARLGSSLQIGLAFASVLIMAYVLPGMHDRYFFPADVIAILFAFLMPRYFYLAILTGMTSFMAYQVFLFKIDVVPMPYLALIPLVCIIILIRWLATELYPAEDIIIPGRETDRSA